MKEGEYVVIDETHKGWEVLLRLVAVDVERMEVISARISKVMEILNTMQKQTDLPSIAPWCKKCYREED